MEATSSQPFDQRSMSCEEAREIIDAIKGNADSLRLMLLELHRRRGWEALGYTSFIECAKAEFLAGRAYIYRLVQSAEVEINLERFFSKSTIVDFEIRSLPVTQLTELAKLPPEKQVEGLLKAEENAKAEGKKRNTKYISKAVKEIKKGVAPNKQRAEGRRDETSEVDVDDVDARPAASQQLIEIDLNEICLRVISNATHLSNDQIFSVLGTFVHRLSSENLSGWSVENLNQVLENANQLIENAHRELSERQLTSYTR